jgi:cardiolipin synthase
VRARVAALLLVAATALGGGCARVPPPLALPAMALGEPSFFPTFEAHTLAPVVGGNRVDILLNGEEIFPALLDAIHSARTSITYAQYSYGDGAVARDIASALAERCRAGVGAKVLLDAFGTLWMPRAYVREMRHSGCHVVYFRPVNPLRLLSANYRNHRRVVVVDGRVGFTGGAGVSRKWMGDGRTERHWRDTDVRVEGPVVEYLQAGFAENWLEATGEILGGEAYFPSLAAPAGGTYAQVVRSSPIAGRYAMYTMYLLAIASAQRSIYITNPYFVPDDALMQEMIRAVERGVRVVLLLPGAIDHTIVREVSRVLFGPLLEAGIEI